MLASLPMYDHPALAEDHAIYWRLIRERLFAKGQDAPETLTDGGIGRAFWTNPNLVLSQTCGYPYKTELYDKVALVGTPDYGVDGCPPGFYRSNIVVRRGACIGSLRDLEGARFAYNERGSQSGFHAFVDEFGSDGASFASQVETGSHHASLVAVLENRADFAVIDAVTWQIIDHHEDICRQLDVLAQTKPTPGLPYICALKIDPIPVAEAIDEALRRLPRRVQRRLRINSLQRLPTDAYLGKSSMG